MKTTVLCLSTALILVLITAGTAWAAGDPAAGKAVFAKKCSSCHGAGGEGKDAIAKMMKVELRPLGSKEVQARSDAELTRTLKEGKGKMKPVALSEKEIADTVAFLRTLK